MHLFFESHVDCLSADQLLRPAHCCPELRARPLRHIVILLCDHTLSCVSLSGGVAKFTAHRSLAVAVDFCAELRSAAQTYDALLP